jgi:hypothetical protein
VNLKDVKLTAIWGGILAVAAAFGLLANWTLELHKSGVVTARSAAAQTITINAIATDVKSLNKWRNQMTRRKRKAALDSLAALEADEGFPGVLPFLGDLFFGRKPKKGGK